MPLKQLLNFKDNQWFRKTKTTIQQLPWFSFHFGNICQFVDQKTLIYHSPKKNPLNVILNRVWHVPLTYTITVTVFLNVSNYYEDPEKNIVTDETIKVSTKKNNTWEFNTRTSRRKITPTRSPTQPIRERKTCLMVVVRHLLHLLSLQPSLLCQYESPQSYEWPHQLQRLISQLSRLRMHHSH